MLQEKHVNLFNIVTSCILTATLIACCVSNRWQVNNRLQTYEGIWRDCQEISFGEGSVCAPFPSKNSLEEAVRVLMVLAILIAGGCIGLTVLSVNVKYISPGHVYACSFVTFILVIIALPIKTHQLLGFMEQSKDSDYAFGWSFYMGWISAALAIFFPLVGLLLLRKLSEPGDTFDEQSDDLTFERF